MHRPAHGLREVVWINFLLGGGDSGLTRVQHRRQSNARQHVIGQELGNSIVTRQSRGRGRGGCWGDRCYATAGSVWARAGVLMWT